MKSAGVERYDIAERSDHVEVRGVSRRLVAEALDLLERVRAVQAEHASAPRDELVHTLMASNVALTPRRPWRRRSGWPATEMLCWPHRSTRTVRYANCVVMPESPARALGFHAERPRTRSSR